MTPDVQLHRTFAERLLGAVKLDATVYEEVEHDPGAMGQAVAVVVLAAVAQGLGAAGHPGGLLAGILSGIAGWLLGTAIVWLIGVRVMRHTSDYAELLRTLAFASAPSVLLAFGVLPIGPLRSLLAIAVWCLVLVAYVTAVRHALDVTTGRAVLVCVLAMLSQTVLLVMLLALIVGASPGAAGLPR